MRPIWYILKTDEDREKSLLMVCRNHLPADLLHDVFTFSYEKMMRYGGDWHIVEKPMFPGYIFMETFKPELLVKAVKQYEPVLELLKNGDEAIAVTEEEERFLNTFCTDEHVLRMSVGIVRDGYFILEKGPLKGHEEFICKVDRHKRLAMVKFCVGGHERIVSVGLEIREKLITENTGRMLVNQA